jgi:hypothetical protein
MMMMMMMMMIASLGVGETGENWDGGKLGHL